MCMLAVDKPQWEDYSDRHQSPVSLPILGSLCLIWCFATLQTESAVGYDVYSTTELSYVSEGRCFTGRMCRHSTLTQCFVENPMIALYCACLCIFRI